MTFQHFFHTATEKTPYDYQCRLAGKLLRPFCPGQIAFQLNQVVRTLDAPLSQERFKLRARHAGKLGRFAKREQAPRIQSHRHFLCNIGLSRRRCQYCIPSTTSSGFHREQHQAKVTASKEDGKIRFNDAAHTLGARPPRS